MEQRRPLRALALATVCVACALLVGCSGDRGGPAREDVSALPTWTFDSSMLFPAGGTLLRPEDGVALPDGRLIVADQVHGLRRIDLDGTSAPFGEMAAAGYVHRPPERVGGANGVSLEPDGAHLLVTDVYQGGIYRVAVATGAAERVYQHRYGVNAAVRDSRGAIWFTQSAHNPAGQGEAALWAAVDRPRPEGALLRLGMEDGRLAAEATTLVDSLIFANGLVLDEAAGQLYLAEIIGGRVLRFRVDLATGRLSERTVFVDGIGADNLELDDAGRLWIAVPISNEVVVVDPATGARRSVFQVQTPAQRERAEELARRHQRDEPALELLTPDLWAPLPGFVTGVIPGRDGGPIYLTGLGNALIRLPR